MEGIQPGELASAVQPGKGDRPFFELSRNVSHVPLRGDFAGQGLGFLLERLGLVSKKLGPGAIALV